MIVGPRWFISKNWLCLWLFPIENRTHTWFCFHILSSCWVILLHIVFFEDSRTATSILLLKLLKWLVICVLINWCLRRAIHIELQLVDLLPPWSLIATFFDALIIRPSFSRILEMIFLPFVEWVLCKDISLHRLVALCIYLMVILIHMIIIIERRLREWSWTRLLAFQHGIHTLWYQSHLLRPTVGWASRNSLWLFCCITCLSSTCNHHFLHRCWQTHSSCLAWLGFRFTLLHAFAGIHEGMFWDEFWLLDLVDTTGRRFSCLNRFGGFCGCGLR